MSEDLSPEEVAAAIDRAVGELLESAGVTGPPVDAVALAHEHLRLETGARRSRRGRTAAAPRPEPTEEARQLAAALEIGRHLKADLFRRLGVEAGEAGALAGASLAKLVASRLLVPTRPLSSVGRACDHDLPALKEAFGTASHELIAWRLLDLPGACVVTVIDDEVVCRRRGNFARVPRALTPAERECLAGVRATGAPAAARSRGWSVRGWPVPAACVAREILHSRVDEDVAGGGPGE